MGNPSGFIDVPRAYPPARDIADRLKDYKEIVGALPDDAIAAQGSRCMDCGVPWCHLMGCPVGNHIPVFNDMVYRGQFKEALDILHSTNNFPEITGRICPAPCEAACTLSIADEPVLIKHIEQRIVEYGFAKGLITPQPALKPTGKSVAIIGSGPAGLACAQQLSRAGVSVTVYEKSDRIGGLMRYGIPEFKLEKWVIDRRLDQMKAEGVQFETRVEIGADMSMDYLRRKFDAVVLATGAGKPREIDIPGRSLAGIHLAVPYLTSIQTAVSGGTPAPSLAGKRVLVIGGGDTGANLVGVSNRQGATSVVQVEILPQPVEHLRSDNPNWPDWPQILRTAHEHSEGCERRWSISTTSFIDDGKGNVRAARCVELDWTAPDSSGRRSFKERPGSEFEIPAEIVLIAAGFVGPETGHLVDETGVGLNPRGAFATNADGATSVSGIFATGDCALGASLVVRAIASGRQIAESVGRFLNER